jgi:hypothetical protein
MKLQATPKNICSGAAALSGSALALVMALVPADHLKNWQLLIVVLAAIAAIGSVIQMFLQSNEDIQISSKIDSLLLERGIKQEVNEESVTASVKSMTEVEEKPKSSEIDGELYRLVSSPRTMAWEILRDIYKQKGKEATVDCDILLEMFLVNRTARDKYIREIKLSAEIDGKRTDFAMQRDLRAKEMSNIKWEFALETSHDFYAPETAMKLLLPEVPVRMTPEQSVEGWVRFMAKDINPDKIDTNSWQCIVVDSLGNEYPITKTGSGGQAGAVTLRRLRG